MPSMGRMLFPALFVAGLAVTAGAQQKGCEIDESTPGQVTRAVLDLQIAQTSQKPEDQTAKLKDAIKLATEGDRARNPVGRAYEGGRALVMFALQPAMASGMTTRGAVGFIDNPAAPFDLYAGIDSAFSVVEASNPECAATTAAYRQQKPWVDLINHAIELTNGGKMDSAVYYAKRSLTLSKNAPYGYFVLAQAAASNSNNAEAISNYKLAIAAAKDTSQADIRRQMLYSLGNLAADAAEGADAAQKATYVNEARMAYDALAKDPGTKYADAARAGTARMALMSGDTSAVKATYMDQLNNPGAFSYNALMSAAVSAAKANQPKDAIKLFEAAHSTNPYHRDALYNLARLYMLDSAYTKGLPLAHQLVMVDPDNRDNYQLLAIGYASMQKTFTMKQRAYDSTLAAMGKRANAPTTKAAAKAALIDSVARLQKVVNSAHYADSAKVYLDSALKYNTMMTSLPAQVTFNEFTPGDGKASVGGTISNQGDAARAFTLKIDFLDKGGNVVTSQTVDVGSIDAKRSKPFHADGTGAGIVAFRYAPIS